MSSSKSDSKAIFQCTMCGECCRGFGGTYVSRADIEAICAYTGILPESFVEKYCIRSGSRLVLKQNDDGYCIFWDQKCTIHPVKPRMCKAWPFIESVLIDVGNWHAMASMCPGIRTDVSQGDILRCVRNHLIPRKKD
jgi:Fe-S-cluster containining protein